MAKLELRLGGQTVFEMDVTTPTAEPAPTPEPEPSEPSTHDLPEREDGTPPIAFLMFGDPGNRSVRMPLEEWRPYLRRGDPFLVSTGIASGGTATRPSPDYRSLMGIAGAVKDLGLRLWVRTTSGRNVEEIADWIAAHPEHGYEGVVLCYERNFAQNLRQVDGPYREDWDYTLRHHEELRDYCHGRGVGFGTKPQGLLLAPWAYPSPGWDYGRLAALSDIYFPQFQAHVKNWAMNRNVQFPESWGRLMEQMEQAGAQPDLFPQLTSIGHSLGNALPGSEGVSDPVEHMERAARAMLNTKATGVMLQYQTDRGDDVAALGRELFERLGRRAV